MSLTPSAKKLLAETIRGTQQDPGKGLRARLLADIHAEADRRYRFSLPLSEAKLDEAHRKRRQRIEAWLDERARASRAKTPREQQAVRDRLLLQAEKEAAATLLNRLTLLRQLEALGLSKPAVLTGGWNSKGYREFRDWAPALTQSGDDTEGYAALLQLLFDELAQDLPGLYGEVGLVALFPIPAATLREVVERLDDPELGSAWTDDTTLGWVYQYWNDPDREALDTKITGGGKIAPHEIAQKTQMFTERYMVEWLLQNSLGLTWLAMCKRLGVVADAEAVLPVLEARRCEWRAQRDSEQVAADALMPIDGELEENWKYYVPQPIPDDAVARAPSDVREIKILDPACGSGHFLVIAFGLLAALYREEARHLGRSISAKQIADSILEHNLYGIDIDPRATQIAAAALLLKAKHYAKDARPRRVNLVAPVLQLGNLPADDPAVVQLRRELRLDAGIPEDLTQKILSSLAGVDYLGSLLKVDQAIVDSIKKAEVEIDPTRGQGHLFEGFQPQQVKLTVGQAKATILERLESFLAKHGKSHDLGLRLDGEQLASGVRFVRIAKENSYDLVVGNPPYQGLSKTESFGYVTKHYEKGKADLYAAFLERGLELAKPGGISALLTMRGWMFLGQFAELRKHLLRHAELRLLCDVDRGAFEDVPDEVLSTVISILRKSNDSYSAIALQPTKPEDHSRDAGRTARKRAAVLAQVGRYEFDTRSFAVIVGEPLVYWWSQEFLQKYAAAPKLGDVSPARFGLNSGDNTRFIRKPWELESSDVYSQLLEQPHERIPGTKWVRYLKGAAGARWFDPCDDAIVWLGNGLEVKVMAEYWYSSYSRQIRNERVYWNPGVSFSKIGSAFGGRVHRFRSVIDSAGSSVYLSDLPQGVCLLNSSFSRQIMESLNPTINFQVGDVNRLPVFPITSATEIFAVVERAFSEHEAARETSVEFKQPGPSAWNDAQEWAQRAVDRAEGEPLPEYAPVYDPPTPVSFVSFAVGVAMGRFGASGEGILSVAPPSALPSGILFLSTEPGDSLDQPACVPIRAAWESHGSSVGDGEDLRTYLRKSFFDYHKKLYESRPIYVPLSSARKNFVAWVSIHRWQEDTLSVLLADHLVPLKRRLEGELEDLRTARAAGPSKGKAERRFAEVQKLLEELSDFLHKVTLLQEQGPPPPDEKTPPREVDARFVMDLDDGVMVNAAALWPLLDPQWKDPKKWWKELATAQGKKDYDWSHLAARYFPKRVLKKCESDPSLAVAHKCFWALHPAKAYAWELRLQDEIGPDFLIEEPGSAVARERFLRELEKAAEEIRNKEQKRREKKQAKEEEKEAGDGPLLNHLEDHEGESEDE